MVAETQHVLNQYSQLRLVQQPEKECVESAIKALLIASGWSLTASFGNLVELDGETELPPFLIFSNRGTPIWVHWRADYKPFQYMGSPPLVGIRKADYERYVRIEKSTGIAVAILLYDSKTNTISMQTIAELTRMIRTYSEISDDLWFPTIGFLKV